MILRRTSFWADAEQPEAQHGCTGKRLITANVVVDTLVGCSSPSFFVGLHVPKAFGSIFLRTLSETLREHNASHIAATNRKNLELRRALIAHQLSERQNLEVLG